MADFIPPIPIGQFRPSSEAIAAWLYEIWKYLQENPIASDVEIRQDAAEIITQNVPLMIAAAISEIEYSDIVTAASALPVYRASNDEMGQDDLREAWAEGCRFALVDDEDFYILYNDNGVIGLVQVLTEAQATGVVSVNGKTGVVVLATSDLQNDSGFITANGAPVQSVNGLTGAVVVPNATTNAAGLMSAEDKTSLNGVVLNPTPPIGICSTAAGTAAKTVTIAGLSTVNVGQLILVYFTHKNTASNPTLNVNGSGAKPVVKAEQVPVAASEYGSWADGQVVMLRYDGNFWFQLTSPFPETSLVIPQETTITPTSSVNSTGSRNCAYRVGRLVLLSLNFEITSATAGGANLFTSIPVPIHTIAFTVSSGSSGKTCKMAVNTNGSVSLDDSSGMEAGWYNGFVMYPTLN